MRLLERITLALIDCFCIRYICSLPHLPILLHIRLHSLSPPPTTILLIVTCKLVGPKRRERVVGLGGQIGKSRPGYQPVRCTPGSWGIPYACSRRTSCTRTSWIHNLLPSFFSFSNQGFQILRKTNVFCDFRQTTRHDGACVSNSSKENDRYTAWKVLAYG